MGIKTVPHFPYYPNQTVTFHLILKVKEVKEIVIRVLDTFALVYFHEPFTKYWITTSALKSDPILKENSFVFWN